MQKDASPIPAHIYERHYTVCGTYFHSILMRKLITLEDIPLELRFNSTVYQGALHACSEAAGTEQTLAAIMKDIVAVLFPNCDTDGSPYEKPHGNTDRPENKESPMQGIPRLPSEKTLLMEEVVPVLNVIEGEVKSMKTWLFKTERQWNGFAKHTYAPFLAKLDLYRKAVEEREAK